MFSLLIGVLDMSWECQIGFHVALHSWWNVQRHHCKTSNVKILLSSLSNDKQTTLTYPLYSADMEPTDGTLQEQEIPASNMTATHLRFTILSGYDHFCAVHKIHVDGTAVHWNNPLLLGYTFTENLFYLTALNLI